MTITNEQRIELRKALSSDAIAQRKGSGDSGPLSYLHGHYVIREMNRIFGNGAWGYRATVTKEWEGQNEKGNYLCTYLGRCVLTVGDCVIEDVGAGQGVARTPPDAIEKAAKEAATDALKRCCKTLGDPLGLALYDKEQAHVGPPDPPTLGERAKALLAQMEAAGDRRAKTAADDACREAWPTLNPTEKAAINKAELDWRRSRGEDGER